MFEFLFNYDVLILVITFFTNVNECDIAEGQPYGVEICLRSGTQLQVTK